MWTSAWMCIATSLTCSTPSASTAGPSSNRTAAPHSPRTGTPHDHRARDRHHPAGRAGLLRHPPARRPLTAPGTMTKRLTNQVPRGEANHPRLAFHSVGDVRREMVALYWQLKECRIELPPGWPQVLAKLLDLIAKRMMKD